MSALQARSAAQQNIGRLSFERARTLTFDPMQQSTSMLQEVTRSVDIGRMLGAGMDTVIVKPFSVETLYKRLTTIVRARKRFVATPTYIGPDRRDNKRSGGEAIPLVEVPNTLAYSALNRMEDRASRIGEAKHAIAVQRVQRMGAEMQRLMAAPAGQADVKAGRRGAAEALKVSLAAVAVSVENDGNDHMAEMLSAAGQSIDALATSCDEASAMAVLQTGGQLSRMDPSEVALG